MDVNFKLSRPQEEFMRRFDDPLVIMQCSVGAGKTYICALWLIINMLKGRRMVAGALTHGALMKTLFATIEEIAFKIGVKCELNKQDKTMKVGSGITFGYSNEAPKDVLGLSNIYGICIDESARCCEEFYNNLSDRIRGENIEEPRKRLISSPFMEPSAQWWNDLKKVHPEAVIRATLYSNPFVSEKYIRELEERYGIGTPLYKMQVLGEDIAADYLNAILRIGDFVDLAGSRFSRAVRPWYYGIDLAGSGRDLTAAATINETGLLDMKTIMQIDTVMQKNMILEAYEQSSLSNGAMDSGGLGIGVYDNIKHIPRVKMEAVNFAQSPSKDMYMNIRSEMYCEAAQAIRDGFYVDVASNQELVEELRNTQVFVNERGKLQIIPKEDIRKNIGRSPDRADALVLAIHAMLHPNPSTNAAEVANRVMAAAHLL
jgi:hypothetical protein